MYFERIPVVELTHRRNPDFNEVIPQGSQVGLYNKDWSRMKRKENVCVDWVCEQLEGIWYLGWLALIGFRVCELHRGQDENYVFLSCQM